MADATTLEALRARVRALARRAQAGASVTSARGLPVLQRGAILLDFAARRASVNGREAPVTAREWAILGHLARAEGRVVPRRELLESIWSRSDEAAAASLEVLIGRIRRKLGAELVRTSRGGGYALADA